jgi:hypothetical protein
VEVHGYLQNNFSKNEVLLDYIEELDQQLEEMLHFRLYIFHYLLNLIHLAHEKLMEVVMQYFIIHFYLELELVQLVHSVLHH